MSGGETFLRYDTESWFPWGQESFRFPHLTTSLSMYCGCEPCWELDPGVFTSGLHGLVGLHMAGDNNRM